MERQGFRSWTIVAIAVLALLVSGLTLAQEQVGSIGGTVSDKEGAVLPGVSVEVTSAGGTMLVAITDIKGEYRFPRLPSGVYRLTAKLDGFVTGEVPSVDLTLGKALKVNFTLQPGTFQDTITVAADTVGIDVTQSATATSIRREQIELVPHGRDFTSVVGQAAGAANENFAGGISIDGSSGSENRFVIDGMDTTDPQTGVSAQNMVVDLIEEVQVKSAGYAAEYGGSTGGVINAIAKSGGNDYKGSAGFFYRNETMLGARRPYTYQDNAGDYATLAFPKDKDTRWEPSFVFGGPIFKDKLYFFVAYEPGLRSLQRTVEGISYDRKETEHFGVANLKGNMGSSFLWKVGANLSPSLYDGTLPDNNAPPGPDAILSVQNHLKANSYSAYADFLPLESFVLSAKAGYFITDQHDTGYPIATDWYYRYALPTSYPVPDALRHPSAWQSNPNYNSTAFDKYTRTAASLDSTWYLEGAGSHAVKVGAQWEKIGNRVSTGMQANFMRLGWNRPDRWFGQRGTYGNLEVERIVTDGDVSSNNLGFFAQDAWNISNQFTLNYGIRTEKEQVPNYNPAYGQWAINFKYGDKLAPRIGFAWDIGGRQQWKVYGSYGTYFDITKMEMPRGSFGGDKWISYMYKIENPDWTQWTCKTSTNIPSDQPCDAATVGPYIGSINLREPSTGPNGGIDPNMKPYQEREFQIGVDHQLSSRMSLGARYVHKYLVRAIEDVGRRVYLPDGSYTEFYTIGNPGEGVDKTVVPGAPDSPKAKRVYDAVELTFNKRLADNWMLAATYTRSRLFGNYSGLASSDEFGRNSPNVNRYFDNLTSSFDQNGNAVYGLLNTDRTHQLKAQLIYQFAFGLSAGLNQYVGSGTPISTRYSYQGVWFFAHGREDQGRYSTLTQSDLMLSQSLFKSGHMELQASLDVLNLFDQKAVTQVGVDKYDSDIQFDCGSTDAYVCFFQHAPFDADAVAAANGLNGTYNYLKPVGWQAPRSIRFGLRFSF